MVGIGRGSHVGGPEHQRRSRSREHGGPGHHRGEPHHQPRHPVLPAPAVVGAPQQIAALLKSHDLKDAALIAEMEAIPRAVWFTSGTPAQVQQQVRQTMAEAAIERAVPVLVAYDIPGRDCAQYSAGMS